MKIQYKKTTELGLGLMHHLKSHKVTKMKANGNK